jgi:hypothetical protein
MKFIKIVPKAFKSIKKTPKNWMINKDSIQLPNEYDDVKSLKFPQEHSSSNPICSRYLSVNYIMITLIEGCC